MPEPDVAPPSTRAEVAVAAALAALDRRAVDTSRDERAARRAAEVVRAVQAARRAPAGG